MTRETLSPAEARAALDKVGMTRAQMVAICNCPPWRHAAFGVIFAVLIGSISISSSAQMIGTGFVLALAALLVAHDRWRYGVFVNGYRRGATLPLTMAYVGVVIALVAAAMHMRLADFSPWSKLALAALAFTLATAVSVKWSRVFRRELEGRA
jgi:drug/metabolite transporter (DMT)-like permease